MSTTVSPATVVADVVAETFLYLFLFKEIERENDGTTARQTYLMCDHAGGRVCMCVRGLAVVASWRSVSH